LLVIGIQGILNDMADVASRYSSDKSMQAKAASLLSYFNTHFKQESSWEHEIPFSTKIAFTRDVILAGEAIDAGVMASTSWTREKY